MDRIIKICLNISQMFAFLFLSNIAPDKINEKTCF
jgi:hypothetical protein